MTLWSALAPFNLGQWFLPHAPGPCVLKRKSKLARTYKPAPLVTPFQKYKKQERALLLSEDTESEYSSDSCSSSSSSSSPSTPSADENMPPSLDASSPPLHYFEPQTQTHHPIPENIRLQMEFAKLRLRPHLHGGRPLQNVFVHPQVRRRLRHQRRHDRVSLALLPTQAPPIFYTNPLALAPCPFPAPVSPPPAYESSFIVQKWHGMKKEADAAKEDRQVYAQIRARGETPEDPTPTIGWR